MVEDFEFGAADDEEEKSQAGRLVFRRQKESGLALRVDSGD